MGQAAEESADDIFHAVHEDSPLQLPGGGLPVHAAHGGGGEISDGLDGVDGEEDADGHAGGGLKMDAEVQGLWQLKQAGGGDAGEIDHAEAGGQQISGDDADEDGRQLEKALEKWFSPVTTARVKKATSQFCQEP